MTYDPNLPADYQGIFDPGLDFDEDDALAEDPDALLDDDSDEPSRIDEETGLDFNAISFDDL